MRELFGGFALFLIRNLHSRFFLKDLIRRDLMVERLYNEKVASAKMQVQIWNLDPCFMCQHNPCAYAPMQVLHVRQPLLAQ